MQPSRLVGAPLARTIRLCSLRRSGGERCFAVALVTARYPGADVRGHARVRAVTPARRGQEPSPALPGAASVPKSCGREEPDFHRIGATSQPAPRCEGHSRWTIPRRSAGPPSARHGSCCTAIPATETRSGPPVGTTGRGGSFRLVPISELADTEGRIASSECITPVEHRRTHAKTHRPSLSGSRLSLDPPVRRPHALPSR